MIEIPLTKGKVALIDDEDAHLARFKWWAARTHFGEFAKLNFPEDAGAPPTRATLRFPGAKLSFAQVAEIQGRRASGERAAALAMEYGVAKSTVNRLVCGCSWAGAPGGGFPIVRPGAAAEDAAVAGLALSGGQR